MPFFSGILTGIIVAFFFTSNPLRLWPEDLVGELALSPEENSSPSDFIVQEPSSQPTLPLSSNADANSLLPPPVEYDSEETAIFHEIWQPFRSEASASGFADYLTRQTGQDFIVEKTAPGEYQVGFFSEGEADRASVLEAIRHLVNYQPMLL